MLFRIKGNGGTVEKAPDKSLGEMGFKERSDLEEWIIQEPETLGEELLVITSEFDKFRDTGDRLDVLALDARGELVVIELKRDTADRTTDLQAIKYASYCSTLTPKDIQEEYRSFWRSRDDDLADSDEEEIKNQIGQRFVDFLAECESKEVTVTEEGWADFELDNQPRILLAAGDFETKITSPVMWLNEEYGLEISCVKLETYQCNGDVYLAPRQVIPIPEAEEYMTRVRKKDAEQSKKEWNGRDFYVQFGPGKNRSWDDAREYGFVSAGHGDANRTYSKQLDQLRSGHRVFARAPGEGYIGVGNVTREATPVKDYMTTTGDGDETPILEADLDAEAMGENKDDLNRCEYLVGVDWIETRDIEDAYWEKGMWFYRHTACPIYKKNRETLEKLYAEFDVEP